MEDKKKADAQEQFLMFLITAIGGDVTAPNEIISEEMKSFKQVHSVEDNDEVTDAMIALSRCGSSEEKLEAIEILAMRFISLKDIMRLCAFLKEYMKHLLDYLSEHPEAREQNPETKAMDLLGGMFGL